MPRILQESERVMPILEVDLAPIFKIWVDELFYLVCEYCNVLPAIYHALDQLIWGGLSWCLYPVN